MDFFSHVPTELKANLAYRVKLREKCKASEEFRRSMLAACRADILFFLAAFGFVYEPRPRIVNGRPGPKRLPFIPWEHQIPIIRQLRETLGFRDVGIKKSRGEGMSWILMYLAVHDWLFDPGAKVAIVSRNEDEADDPENPDSLGWKCLEVSTPVLTPTGWRPLFDIKAGESVIGSSGNPVSVKAVVPPHEADLYMVTFSDGTWVRCTGDHRFPVTECWQRQSIRRLYAPHESKCVSVAEMAGNLRGGAKHWNYQIQETPAIEFPEKELPLDPYIVGVMLGDGTFSKDTPSFASVDEPVVALVRTRGGNVQKWGGIEHGLRGSMVHFKRLGLRGKRAWEKFLPDCYKFSSRSQRLELLRGLMDTDGNVKKDSGLAVFNTSSAQLARDVRDLVLSLGGSATIGFCRSRYRYKGEIREGRVAFRVSVSLADNPFNLPRKAKLYRSRKHTTGRRIVGIRRCGRGIVSCLEVDAPDHLFVIDGHLLTHNCDWIIEQLPPWMRGEKGTDWDRNKSKHSWANRRNGAQINMDAATGNAFRGGRAKWAAFDEFAFFTRGEDIKALASSHGATDSRLFISTVNGTDNEYYRVMTEPSGILRLEMSWRDNPTKNRGMYLLQGYRPDVLDAKNPLPTAEKPYRPEGSAGQELAYDPPNEPTKQLWRELRQKGFKLEGKIRSPWYDHQCNRAGTTPFQIARELDMDWGGSMTHVFSGEFFEAAGKTKREPILLGRLAHDHDKLEVTFVPDDRGNCKLWTRLDVRNNPPEREYAVAADISLGVGGEHSSNSVVSVLDLVGMEQVLELTTSTLEPADFADLCIAIAKWFSNAEIGWEANGPGTQFTSRVRERGYGRVYRRRQHKKVLLKKTDDLGWWSDKTTKDLLFLDFSDLVRTNGLIVRSEELIKECGQYVRDHLGRIKHAGTSVGKDGAADPGEAHGDRVIAFGVAVQIAKRRMKGGISLPGQAAALNLQQNPPPGSPAYRLKLWQDAQEREEDVWDHRTNHEIMGGTHDWEGHESHVS